MAVIAAKIVAQVGDDHNAVPSLDRAVSEIATEGREVRSGTGIQTIVAASANQRAIACSAGQSVIAGRPPASITSICGEA